MMNEQCRCPNCGCTTHNHQSSGWGEPEVREVIWDKGMPQESREIVRPGDANWSMGTPINR